MRTLSVERPGPQPEVLHLHSEGDGVEDGHGAGVHSRHLLLPLPPRPVHGGLEVETQVLLLDLWPLSVSSDKPGESLGVENVDQAG